MNSANKKFVAFALLHSLRCRLNGGSVALWQGLSPLEGDVRSRSNPRLAWTGG